MNDWANFLIAEIGAAAALTGLIFVSVSLNLAKILTVPTLADRALIAILLLLTVLIICTLLIVPAETTRLAGWEVLGTGLVAWIMVVRLDLRILRHIDPTYRHHMQLSATINQLPVLLYGVTGIAVLMQGAAGLYWLVPATLISFIKALADAWVLLVEINR
jgi:modulator of FtsH protease